MLVTIQNGLCSASIDTKGAQLTSYFDGARELIWQADPRYWGKSFPILFPIIGLLKDNRTIIDGKEYIISKHGFARDWEFSLLSRQEDLAVFRLEDSPETLSVFPRRFSLTVCYTLQERGLSIDYQVENKDTLPMPYCFGLHPALCCPMTPEEDFSQYALTFEKPETINSPAIMPDSGVMDLNDRTLVLENARTLPLRYELFDRDALTLEELSSSWVQLSGPSGKGVQLSFSGFTSLGLWTPDHKQAPFLCIEPWAGMNDRTGEDGVLAHKYGARTAAPGETDRYSLLITPLG